MTKECLIKLEFLKGLSIVIGVIAFFEKDFFIKKVVISVRHWNDKKDKTEGK